MSVSPTLVSPTLEKDPNLAEWHAHRASVFRTPLTRDLTAVTFSSDARLVALGDSEGEVTVLEKASGRVLWRFKLSGESAFLPIAGWISAAVCAFLGMVLVMRRRLILRQGDEEVDTDKPSPER
jgi:hypothetical protein